MDKIFVKGCDAIAEAAVRAGCGFYAGYPITPQNEIPEYMARRMPELGRVFIQGESEIASIYMLYGASCAGTRVMTSSSGPGISLKAEGISYLSSAQLPAVIINVTRSGPGLGKISPAQNDYWLSTKAPGHGGFKVMVFAPSTVQEAVDLTYLAFDYADRDRNPVIVMVDGIIAAMMESVTIPEFKTKFIDKGQWVSNGCKGRLPRIIQNSALTNEKWEEFKRQRAKLFEQWDTEDVRVEEYLLADAEYVIVSYGTSARIAKTAVAELRKQGLKVGMIRPITVSPFPYASFSKLDSNKVKGILDIEMSIPGQMIDDVRLAMGSKIKIDFLGRDGGFVSLPEVIIAKIKDMADGRGK